METNHLKNSVEHTCYKHNPVRESRFDHPLMTVEKYAPTWGPFEAVDLFCEDLITDDEFDDGDWRRAANASLLQLRERLREQPEWVLRTLDHMQELLLWRDGQTPASLRVELVRRAQGIAQGLVKGDLAAGVTSSAAAEVRRPGTSPS